MTTETNYSTENLLRWTEIQARIPISRSHAHALVAKGQFPKPLKLIPGGRASAWLESEIDAWIADRIAESRPNEQASVQGGEK